MGGLVRDEKYRYRVTRDFKRCSLSRALLWRTQCPEGMLIHSCLY